MDGIFINGARPTSKKAVKEAVLTAPETVYIERTSVYKTGNETHEPLDMPVGDKVHFVGPDPYTKRVFYGTIQRTKLGFKVT